MGTSGVGRDEATGEVEAMGVDDVWWVSGAGGLAQPSKNSPNTSLFIPYLLSASLFQFPQGLTGVASYSTWMMKRAHCAGLGLTLAWLLSVTGSSQVPSLVDSDYDGRTFRMTIPCKAAGRPVVYTLSRPERVVVEMPEGVSHKELRAMAHAGPKVHIRELGLERAQVVVEMEHRVPPNAIKTRTTGEGIELEVNTTYEVEESFTLTSGVRWRRREWVRQGEYCLWNELLVDPRDPAVKLEVGLAHDRLDSHERPSAMSARLGGLAAVNGGYFGRSGGPLGVVVKNGKILAPNVSHRPPRTVLGIMQDGHAQFDRMVATKAGTLASRSGETWEGVRLALGAGPRLVCRGKVALTTDEEELGPRGNDITRKAARTAVATLKDGKILIVTAVGYRDLHRQGPRLEELAEELVRRGAAEAMNLDGGSSTSMSIGRNVVSNGAGSPRLEKEVATSLVVVDPRPARFPASIHARIDNQHLQADGESEAVVSAEVRDAYGKALPDGTPVRVFTERCTTRKDCYKMEGGRATIPIQSVASAGDARVRLECAWARQDVVFHLDPGPAEKLSWRTTLGKVTELDQEVALVVYAADRWGNPVNSVMVSCCDDKGVVLESGATGKNGKKTFMLHMPVKGGKVTLQIPGLGSRNVMVPAAPMAPASPLVPLLKKVEPVQDPGSESTPEPQDP